MPHHKKYKFIACFLLLVFSVSTIAGFACSIGVDMGYNTKHHATQQATSRQHEHCLGNTKKNTHSPSSKASPTQILNVPDDCCSGQVSNFAQLDKAVTYNNLLLSVPIFSNGILSNFFLTKNQTTPVNSVFQFVRRNCIPNDTDIRIVIQSFQI